MQENTSPVIPSQLCRRYILSSPPSGGSSHVGRVASSMALLMTPMPMTPVYCISTVRSEKKVNGPGTHVSASCHSAVSTSSSSQKPSLMFFMPKPDPVDCQWLRAMTRSTHVDMHVFFDPPSE